MKSKTYTRADENICMPETGISLPNLEKAIRIGLSRFPESKTRGEPFERIPANELEKRLNEISKTGFPIKSYDRMGNKELWNYIEDIKTQLKNFGAKYCPDVVREVRVQNSEIVRKTKGYR
jgi:hypothetical protein